MKIDIPQQLKELARRFDESGGRLFAVGGMVRNGLLSLPLSDMDICSALSPEQVMALCQKHSIGCTERGAFFGTVAIRTGGLEFEHATFRSERYGEGGCHRPQQVRLGATLDEDAFRRDFTVNALYYDILGETLIDPTGGMADLQSKLIRATSPEPDVIIRDDGLRILRMVRFASELGFAIDGGTLSAAKRNISGLRDLSPERIRDELDKILLSDIRCHAPGECGREYIYAALEVMDQTGAWDIIMPELARGRGLEQRHEYHDHDVLRHSLHACACAKPVLYMRLAALLHDVGKPEAVARGGRMLGHDKYGEAIAREIMSGLRYPRALTDRVCGIVRHHMYDLSGAAKESTLRAKFVRLGRELAFDLIDIREADVRGSSADNTGPVATAERWRNILAKMEAEGAPFSEAELNCTGADIMEWTGLSPSNKVGEIKRRLLEHCARYPRDNTRERLKTAAKGMCPSALS